MVVIDCAGEFHTHDSSIEIRRGLDIMCNPRRVIQHYRRKTLILKARVIGRFTTGTFTTHTFPKKRFELTSQVIG